MPDTTYDVSSVRSYLQGLQTRIADAIGALDGKPFGVDAWQRTPGEHLRGGGVTRILEDGALIERGGVGFSDVAGDKLPPSASALRPHLAGRGFEAMGVSLVMHPRNPYCPTAHMNVRMLAATKEGEAPVFWFGGGMDLTPYYGFEDDAAHFHRVCRDALAPFGADLYPRFKRWCDDYFFLKHRGETRGVGGVFFDDFDELGFERSFEMVRSVGDAFVEAYLPLLENARPCPTANASAHSRAIAAAATWNSISCSTVAHCSGCKAAAGPSRFCYRCRLSRTGVTTGSPSRARPKRSCTPIS